MIIDSQSDPIELVIGLTSVIKMTSGVSPAINLSRLSKNWSAFDDSDDVEDVLLHALKLFQLFVCS